MRLATLVQINHHVCTGPDRQMTLYQTFHRLCILPSLPSTLVLGLVLQVYILLCEVHVGHTFRIRRHQETLVTLLTASIHRSTYYASEESNEASRVRKLPSFACHPSQLW